MKYALPILLLALCISCTTYSHREEVDAEGNVVAWETKIKRTWGTSNTEFFVNTTTERGSMGGNGMSSNMRDVLGDDAVGKIVKGVTGRDYNPNYTPVPREPDEIETKQ